MTNKQLQALCDDLLKAYLPDVKKQCKSLINSGAIDCSEEDCRTYRMAKNVLAVAMESVAKGITKFNDEDTETRKNLRNI